MTNDLADDLTAVLAHFGTIPYRDVAGMRFQPGHHQYDKLAHIRDSLRQMALVRAMAIEEAVCALRMYFATHGEDMPGVSRDALYVALHGTIRSLSPITPEAREAWVEKIAKAMNTELKSRPTKIKHADGIWLHEVVAGDLERIARAVLAVMLPEG